MRKCCGNCFGDTFLASQIELNAKETGDCEFCLSKRVKLIDPSRLIDYFEALLSLYKENTDSNACGIEKLLRTDWELFEKLDSVKAEMLIGLIFDDINIVKKNYAPTIQDDKFAVKGWEDFREELKHQNRFFPKNAQATDQLKKLFDFFIAASANIPSKVYRARICDKPSGFALLDMGKPPAELTSNGRANPIGIPCLYVASDSNTAISEIRPTIGEIVSVAEFDVYENIQLVDLRSPRKTVSPFDLFEEQIKLLRRYMKYVCRLSEELTLPVSPKTAHLEYLPSQYLCEFIKHCGYDGVIYRSAMGNGVNYAIFNDDKVAGINVRHYKIDDISAKYSEYTC